MPHIEVKLYPGYDKDKVAALSQQLVQDTQRILGVPERVISLAVEEVPPEAWNEKVYEPLIQSRDGLMKAPEY